MKNTKRLWCATCGKWVVPMILNQKERCPQCKQFLVKSPNGSQVYPPARKAGAERQ